MDKNVYEIFVPTVHRTLKDKHGDAKPYRVRYHRVWDAKVRSITSGLTICAPVKGQWVSFDGELFSERMIPVRIMATRDEIDQIIDFTMEYYDQLAVFAYRISDEPIMKHREL